jgi:hypothetical protein
VSSKTQRNRGWLFAFAAIVLYGCTGQSLEGAWYGPLPIDEGGSDCRIRLYGNRTFDFTCRDPSNNARDRELGAGRYSTDGTRITFDLRATANPDRVSKIREKVFSAEFLGRGNEIDLTFPGRRVTWKRGEPQLKKFGR